MAEETNPRNSSTQLLAELEELSQSLYQSHTARRTASLALPRSSVPPILSADEAKNEEKSSTRGRSRRMSLSPWRSRPKLDDGNGQKDQPKPLSQQPITKLNEKAASAEKKGIWNWKPIRALSHIGMQKLSCLFSVEVVTVQGLPASMNGLRLSVCVRKKETKEGAVHTMPSRVSQGAADFEETMFLKCHVYCSYDSGKQQKFEPRPFLIYVFAVDAQELDFGRSLVDLSLLIQESIEKSAEDYGERWGVGIYSQSEGLKSGKSMNFASSFGRKQSKSSFSIPSPRMSSRSETWTPSQGGATGDLQGIDDLNLDEPAPVPSTSPSIQKSEETESKIEDLDVLDFDVVDKGVEIQDKEEAGEGEMKENVDKKIKALESMMGGEKLNKTEEETDVPRLDADEETVTREFLQMLEAEDDNELRFNQSDIPPLKLEGVEDSTEADTMVFLPDLGKGLGCVVQTRDGGYLAAMNPLDTAVTRKDTPKLAMQLSKALVLTSHKSMNGFELFQKMAATGLEELSSEILSSMPLDELIGKTAEQIAFEGIASAIILGRNKEGASSSAARTVAAVKTMATAMNTGRRERISTGIWNVNEDPLTVDEILAFSMQKIEAMAVEALKIQADMAEEDAPFEVSSLVGKTATTSGKDQNHPLASAIPLEEWMKNSSLNTSDGDSESQTTLTLTVVVQLRDPIRRFESVGGPVIVLIHATHADVKPKTYDEDKRFKVGSLHIGGLKVKKGGKRNVWDTEKQRLTAMQWLLAFGLGKAGKKGKHVPSKSQDILWSISSRVMADMWLKSMRNPDIKFTK
ncbi:Protein plastid movement impared 1 [Vitis vinifera]|uniref:Protein plastid movement impared 1 n=1 Tax=Vitis vinifera TaxID=29760 RepID=A0A438ET10_VITVI|nr:Protein plastid movement impared 1 [Vitis vinifera]